MANLLSTIVSGSLSVNLDSSGSSISTVNNGNASRWYGRITTFNSTSDKSVFLGTYASVAVVGAHNNALTAWANLYVNNVDGVNGGNVYLPTNSYVANNSIVHTGGGQTIAGITYFSNGESLNLYGIRGRFANEYIHLYNKVGIGNPSGWGQGQAETPSQGLSTYGGINVSYGTGADSTFNGKVNILGSSMYVTASQLHIGKVSSGTAQMSFESWGSYTGAIAMNSSGQFHWGGQGASEWYFKTYSTYNGDYSASGNTAARIASDGNIWMSWAGDWLSNLLGAKQNASTAITTSNIGSQSVSYASESGTFSTGRTNYKGNTDNAVAGQLMWKNYGNNHTIFDASNSTSPNGGGVNNTNPDVAWTGTYPTLMGWNGANTYGVRVDSSRNADYAGNAGALSGLGVTSFLRDDGWNTYPGQDANTQGEMRVDFTYSNNAPYTGELIRFGSSGYSTQFNTSYGNSDNFAFRTRNGDTASWNAWRNVIHSGNIGSQSVSYASSAGNADTLDSLDSSEFARGRAAYQVLNLDDVKQPGLYQYDGGIGGTQPAGTNWSNVKTIEIGSSVRYSQFVMPYSNNRVFYRHRVEAGWQPYVEFITSGNIASQSVSYADESGFASSAGAVEWTSVQNKPATFPPSSHNHDDRYLVKGGSWYGLGLPGSRWGGFTVSGGEIVFGDGLPNAGQMGILIDGAYLAGENNGFWSLPSDNSWSGRRGMYWDGSNLNFTANSPTALFNSIRLSTSTNNGTISGGGDWGIRFANDNGWIQFGPANNSWTHIYTDKNFYFNQNLYVNGNLVALNSSSPTFQEVYANGWFRTTGHQGLYNPTNNAHFYPNNASYGSWRIDGSRNGWAGLHFESGATLMMNSNTSGVHREGYGWQFRWDNGTLYVGKNTYGGGTDATVLDSSNFTSWAQQKENQRLSTSDTPTFAGLNAHNGIVKLNEIRFTDRNGSTHSDPYTLRWIDESSTRGAGLSWLEFQLNDDSNEEIRIYGNSCVGFSCGTYSDNLYHRFRADGYAWHGGTVEATDVYGTNRIYGPEVLVNNHSDNTRGYRIHNTSGTSVSAMFTNSANSLVIGAGAFDQVQLNKKVLVSGAALGVNVAASATAGRIDASNDIVAYSTSDERFKENITPIANALDKVKTLTGVEFDWRMETKDYHGYVGHDVGVIAQQVKAVLPEAVRTNANGYLAVRYEKLIGLLIEGMKEQQAQIDELKAKLDGLAR
jgi:hypothetical protein